MKFTSQLIKRAWAIRKNAAATLNCRVMEILWGPCFRQAKNEEINMEHTLQSVKSAVEGVAYAKLWETNGMSRVYLTPVNGSRRYRGEQTTKIYFDLTSQKLVVTDGKGLCSEGWHSDLEKIQEILG